MSCTVPETHNKTDPPNQSIPQRTPRQHPQQQQLTTDTRAQLDGAHHWRNVLFTIGTVFLLFGLYNQGLRGLLVGVIFIAFAWLFQLTIPREDEHGA